jgi:U3 small nucleolar RNA-associated protein 11
LGILEKHGDYKQRAVDYHNKERHLQRLRQKASQRNPDEFYFGMHKAQIQDGRHRPTQAARQEQFDAEIGNDTIKLLKDQDLSYVRMQRQKDAKKVERLQASLHFLEPFSGSDSATGASTTTRKRKHTVFVDSQEAAQSFNAAEHFDTHPELVNRPFHRPRMSDWTKDNGGHTANSTGGDDDECSDDDKNAARSLPTTQADLVMEERQARKLARKIAKARDQAYQELHLRSKRAAKLRRAEAHLETEKNVAGKGRKRKIAPAANGQPAQYKWRRKRLR